jgi:hypothetical protein
MRPSVQVFGAVTLVMTLLAGCGTAIRPQVTVGEPDRTLGSPPRDRLGPRLAPDRDEARDKNPMVDQVCRVHSVRSGWIATRYTESTLNCPKSTDPEDSYNTAIIERYSHKQIGETMVVCADQPVPREWAREYHRDRDVSATCPGARVRDGSPTVMTIRRVSAR